MSKPLLNKWQQWGLWLGKKIEDFPDPTDRTEIQAHITTYIARKKKELQPSRTELDYYQMIVISNFNMLIVLDINRN